MMIDFLKSFYQGKRVFLTGHTGFKGSWAVVVLNMLGAKVYGYSLEPPTTPALYEIANLNQNIYETIADIRDHDSIVASMVEFEPDIVIHMAAQPIVRLSYQIPVETYATNVMGTVNILDAVRVTESVKSVLNVTTDKVYKNNEWTWGYRETDELGGRDPYSNSKSCSELVTASYRDSFLLDQRVGVSTARAGNVIGGGDFAHNRIIPDCVRAAIEQNEMVIRNPDSTRPYQHVLEPIFAYLLISASQYTELSLAGSYNIGPDDEGCTKTSDLVKMFSNYWGKDFEWKVVPDNGPHEASYLKLDCSLIKSVFSWSPRWSIDTAVEKTVEWTKKWQAGDDVLAVMENQIDTYMNDVSSREK